MQAKGVRVVSLILSAVVGIGLLPRVAAAQSNPIVIENQQPGTSSWQIPWGAQGADATGQIKGYASATSVNKGEQLTLYVTVNPAQNYSIDVYRLGWYQGLGGRLMQHIGPVAGVHQATCPTNATTGMIECQWTPSYTLTTQTSWTSGIYVALLTNAQAFQNYIIFTVRDDGRVAPLLYQQEVTTYQAYNDYPYDNTTGKSLYTFNSYGAKTVSGGANAVKVSFDRPYNFDGTGSAWGQSFLNWEYPFIRWMEKSGYDVTYATDVDAHTNGNRLLNYNGIISGAHDEYFSKEMYDAFVNARDAGVNLAFFGADAIGWQIRFESSSSGVPNRVIVCYRDATLDPVSDPTLKTVEWTDPPLNRPEQTLKGIQYTAVVPWHSTTGAWANYVVTNSGNWVYAGTGFKDGDSVPGIAGYEADRFYSNLPSPNAAPGTFTLLSQSTLGNGGANDYSNSSIYQAISGAWVFTAGTTAWSLALDNYNGYGLADARIQKTTANILDRFVNPAVNFSLAASPASQTVLQGGATSYGVTISPAGGFAGQVTLSVSGLPAGASASFAPNPATTSSTLSVATIATTPTGTYTLTITGVSGALTHTATVSLVVNPPPNFTLNSSPSSQTASQGGSTPLPYSVTISPTNGFSGQVGLSVSGLPSGATGSFSVNPATTSSALSVTTATTTPAGTYTLTITGVSGTLTHTATVSLVVVAPDFTMAASPASQTASQGGSTPLPYNVTISPTNGFSGQVSLSVSGLPSGATGSFSPNPATTSSALSVTTISTTPAGTYTLTITGVSGTLTHTATVSLVVVAPDFTMAASPASQTVMQGSSTASPYGVTISPTNGFSGQVSLSVSGLPSGATGSFSVNPATTSSALSVTTISTTPAGTYTLTITGVSGTLTHTATVSLVVVVPDFTMAPSPASRTVNQGSPTTYGVTISPTNGFSGQVSLSVSGLPTGATGSFSPNPATTSSTLSVTTATTTPAGTYTVTITGTSGTLTHTATVSLVVLAADFTMAPSPASRTVNQGSPTTYGITISPTNGFAGQVDLSVTGLPTGATGSFSPNPATTSSTLSVTTATTTPAGTYTVTITGVSGTLTHTATVSLVVLAADFTMTSTPSSQTVAQGGATSYGVTISPTNGFSGQVSLSVSGLPTGAIGTFTPNPATTSSTMAVTTISTTPAGTYALTITGVSGSLTHTSTVSLTVARPGVTFDNAVTSGFQWSVTSASTPAFTIGSGANRAAMIMVSMSANNATGMTASLGGVPATLVPGTDSGTTASVRTMIFQVINPPSGSQTATVSWTTSMHVVVSVMTVAAANQTTPVTNGTFVAVNTAPSSATSLAIASTPGDLTASVAYTTDAWVTPYTNQTLTWGPASGATAGDRGAGTGTTTHTWTDAWAFQTISISGANFKAF